MSPPPTRPEILLLHGGWHTPASYQALTSALTSAGHVVHCPLLPSMSGTIPAVDDLYTDSAHVRSVANSLVSRGAYLVVLMHSYGGQVGTNALSSSSSTTSSPSPSDSSSLTAASRARRGLPGGILHLVYMTAYAVAEGMSMNAWVAKMGHADLLPVVFDFSDPGFVKSKYPKELVVGEGELAEPDMDEYLATWTSWAVKGWADEVRACAWREEVGVSYIVALRDKTIPVEYQREFVRVVDEGRQRGGRGAVEVLEVEGAHCLNVSATEEVVALVRGIAERAWGGVPAVVAASGAAGGANGERV